MNDSSRWIIERGSKEKIGSKVFGAKLVEAREKSLLRFSPGSWLELRRVFSKQRKSNAAGTKESIFKSKLAKQSNGAGEKELSKQGFAAKCVEMTFNYSHCLLH